MRRQDLLIGSERVRVETVAAVALGIDVLEVHVTLSRDMFGPDVPASLTTEELRQLVEGVRFIEKMNAHPVNKDEIAQDLHGMRQLFTKSIVAKEDLPAGTILKLEHLAIKKPGTGIPSDQLHNLIGRRLISSVFVDDKITEELLEAQKNDS